MSAPSRILIAHSDVAFAATLKQAIETGGAYQAAVAATAAIALDAQAAAPFDLAILDLGLEDLQGADLVRALRRQQPDLRILVSLRDERRVPDDLAALHIQGVLPRPLMYSELPALLAAAMARSVPPAPHHAFAPTVDRVARQFESLAHESGAHAALLTETGALVAHTGQLPPDEVEMLTALLTEAWRAAGKQNGAPPANEAQVRYIRLRPDGPDYLLYSAPVVNSTVLSLVFHADTPLGVIRSQARRLSDALRQGLTQPGSTAAGTMAGLAWETLPPAATEMPPPPQASSAVAEGPAAEALEPPDATLAPPHEELPATDADPLSGARRAGHSVYNLSYALVWLPRFATTELKGDVALRLAELIGEIAAGYEWQVSRLDVQPESVQVVIAAGPDDAVATIVETLKRLTSDALFEEFPRLRQRHPAGRLWADGHLALAGATPVSPEQLRRYIAYARQDRL
jgi:putative transposase